MRNVRQLNSLLLCLLLLSGQSLFAASEISTLVGNGSSGYLGDGGSAPSASLSQPESVARDSGGNLYIADTLNQVVRKVAVDGTVTTVAGSGTPGFSSDGGVATQAKLNYPCGVALDSSGSQLFIADTANNRVRRVNLADGVISTVAGNGLVGFAGDGGPALMATLNAPRGVVLASDGTLYIADSGNGRIRQLRAGVISSIAGNGLQASGGDGGSATAASLNLPSHLALLNDNRLYVSELLSHRIRMIDLATGLISTVAGNGNAGFSGDGGMATSAALNSPQGVAVDGLGNLFIADEKNQRIRYVAAASGIITTLAGSGIAGFGGDGGSGELAQLNQPAGLSVDSAGDLYLADRLNQRIRYLRVDLQAPIGSLTTLADTNRATIPLTLTCRDNKSGCVEMRFSNDGISWSGWQPYATTTSWTLSAGDGAKSVFGQLRDGMGNRSLLLSLVTTANGLPTPVPGLRLDTQAPNPPLISAPLDNTLSNVAIHTVAGSAEASSNVEVFSGASQIGLVKVDSTGVWSLNNRFNEGDHPLTAISVDIAGNRSQPSAVVNLAIDLTPPQLSLNGVSPLTIDVLSNYSDPGVTISDNRDTDLSAALLVNSNVDSTLPGSYSVSYDVSDLAGNAATQLVREVIVADLSPPVITLLGPMELSIEVNSVYSDAGATASDLFDGDLSAQLVMISSVDTSKPGQYPVLYNVKDAAGNAAAQVVRTVTVADTQPPVISLTGGAVTLEAGTAYSEPGVSALDAFEGDLSASISVSNPLNIWQPGVYTLTYTVSDSAGNLAASSRVVTVVDTTPPLLILNGSPALTLEAAASYTDAGATATDLVDGDLSAQIAVLNPVVANQVGSYSVVYTVTDAAGNVAGPLQRSITIVDTTPPLLTLLGDNPAVVEVDSPYSDAGVTLSDIADSEATLRANLQVDIQVDTSALSNSVITHLVTYQVSDSAGNSTTVIRTVMVVDTTPPLLTLNGDNPLRLDLFTAYSEPGVASVVDSYDGDVSATLVISGSDAINSSVPGRYAVNYTAQDNSGNVTRVVRQVEVYDYLSLESTNRGGALDPWWLLPLAGLALWRRRRGVAEQSTVSSQEEPR